MLPIGGIIKWFAAIADIPAGYHLCDGTNGTPDLLNRFARAAGGAIAPGTIGTATEHDHEFTGDGHEHSIGTKVNIDPAGTTSIWSSSADGDETNSESAEGVTDKTTVMPPYCALAFIQRLA